MRSAYWIFILCCATAGCSNAAIPPSERLDRISVDYIHQHYPSWGDEHGLKRIIIDHGDYWEWTFQLPDWTVGGVPVVLIDKKDLHVITAYHTQ